MLLTPALMIGMSLLTALFTGGKNLTLMLPMLGMGLAMPIASLIGHRSQKKKYEEFLVTREIEYKQTLEKEKRAAETGRGAAGDPGKELSGPGKNQEIG